MKYLTIAHKMGEKNGNLKIMHYKWSDKYYLKKYYEKLKIYAMNLEQHEKKIKWYSK